VKSFEEHLEVACREAALPSRSLRPGECQTPSRQRCTLCHAGTMSYEDELKLKNRALQAFWRERFGEVTIGPLVASPLGRGYRTVTKRKVFRSRRGLFLGLISPSDDSPSGGIPVVECVIEPSQHAAIYAAMQQHLLKPHATPLIHQLTYVIIKGNYSEFTLMLNVMATDPALVKAANTISKATTRSFPSVTGVFLYEGGEGNRYYMGRAGKGSRPQLRRLFGKSDIHQRMSGRSFLYTPASFSQVNPGVAELMVDGVGEMLGLPSGGKLFDLYCGYGLFSLCLAGGAKRVLGVDVSHESITSAMENARRQRASNVRFVRSDVNTQTLQTLLRDLSPEDRILLDPPRTGVAPGAIEFIAAKGPERVVHIFCNTTLIEGDVRNWKATGYRIDRAVAFDMFPGTDTMEIAVSLTR
jgi:tRNA/tmRNA/rRNA uracil-C5-methylase (TrmA/RlmC/RlmD family)